MGKRLKICVKNGGKIQMFKFPFFTWSQVLYFGFDLIVNGVQYIGKMSNPRDITLDQVEADILACEQYLVTGRFNTDAGARQRPPSRETSQKDLQPSGPMSGRPHSVSSQLAAVPTQSSGSIYDFNVDLYG